MATTAHCTILIVPNFVKDIMDIPGSMMRVSEAHIVVTHDGRCLKNRYAREDRTVVEVM